MVTSSSHAPPTHAHQLGKQEINDSCNHSAFAWVVKHTVFTFSWGKDPPTDELVSPEYIRYRPGQGASAVAATKAAGRATAKTSRQCHCSDFQWADPNREQRIVDVSRGGGAVAAGGQAVAVDEAAATVSISSFVYHLIHTTYHEQHYTTKPTTPPPYRVLYNKIIPCLTYAGWNRATRQTQRNKRILDLKSNL